VQQMKKKQILWSIQMLHDELDLFVNGFKNPVFKTNKESSKKNAYASIAGQFETMEENMNEIIEGVENWAIRKNLSSGV